MSTDVLPALTPRTLATGSDVDGEATDAAPTCRSCRQSATRLRRGQCTPCYLRSLGERKAAGIFTNRRITTPPLLRLLAKVTPGSRPAANLVGGCWLYTGRPFANGYGQFSLANHNVKAHRAAFALLIGPLVAGRPLPHLCRVRCCINPAHLDPADGTTATERASAARVAIAAAIRAA
jgi:hypothetical protein